MIQSINTSQDNHLLEVDEISLAQECYAPKEGCSSVGKDSVLLQAHCVHDLPYNRSNYLSEYRSWDNMKQRRKKGYKIDPRFVDFHSFMSNIGPKPDPSYTLDRIDHNNPEYSPENCRWASKSLQTANRSNTRYLTDFGGTKLTVSEWSKRTSLRIQTILARVDKHGWSEHDAVHTPVNKKPTSSKPSKGSSLGNTYKLFTVFQNKLKTSCNVEFVPVTPKDKKLLIEVATYLMEGKIPYIEAIEIIIDNWIPFTKYAESNYSIRNAPMVPTPQFMRLAIAAVGNYFLEYKKSNGNNDELHLTQPKVKKPK